MSAFEIIDKDEFEKSSGMGEVSSESRQTSEPPIPGQLHLEWCEFCKGYYIMEYHHGEGEDESGR